MQFVFKTFSAIAAESTCQKRVTVCDLYAVIPGYEDSYRQPRILVSRESNRCEPPAGKCSRLGVCNSKADYPESSCNWTHAEIRALAANKSGLVADTAVVYGHDFVCEPCEKALKAAGVKYIRVEKHGPENCRKSAGLRPIFDVYRIEL